MPTKRPLFNAMNLFIMSQMLFQILALGLVSGLMVLFTGITLSIAWGYCTPTDFGALVRAGSVVQIIAFGYILIEEVWKATPTNMADEIEANFIAMKADGDPEAAPALVRFRTFAAWSTAIHKPVVRVLEASLVILGGTLNGFGDLIGKWL